MLNSKIVVYAYVCGDILHRGHLLALRNAKKFGDFLIVGVLTDEAIMEKKNRPIVSFVERLELVEALGFVDVAVPQHTYTPWENIKNLKPDILMESTNHDEELIKKSREAMREIGGKVLVSPYFPDQSSTKIKNKIKKNE